MLVIFFFFRVRFVWGTYNRYALYLYYKLYFLSCCFFPQSLFLLAIVIAFVLQTIRSDEIECKKARSDSYSLPIFRCEKCFRKGFRENLCENCRSIHVVYSSLRRCCRQIQFEFVDLNQYNLFNLNNVMSVLWKLIINLLSHSSAAAPAIHMIKYFSPFVRRRRRYFTQVPLICIFNSLLFNFYLLFWHNQLAFEEFSFLSVCPNFPSSSNVLPSTSNIYW